MVRRSLDSENDYTLVENLAPGTTYHVALLKSDDAVLWKDDVKTKSVTGKFPLLKYQQVDGYMLVQLLNLPDDVSSYKVKLDGQEINIVNKNLNGQILTAEVTYKMRHHQANLIVVPTYIHPLVDISTKETFLLQTWS